MKILSNFEMGLEFVDHIPAMQCEIWCDNEHIGNIAIDSRTGKGEATYRPPWQPPKRCKHFFTDKTMREIRTELRSIFARFVIAEVTA